MTKKEKIEAQLFIIWIDLYYTVDLFDDQLKDAQDFLKDIKKGKRKAIKLLKKCEEKYEAIYGRKPKIPKKSK